MRTITINAPGNERPVVHLGDGGEEVQVWIEDRDRVDGSPLEAVATAGARDSRSKVRSILAMRDRRRWRVDLGRGSEDVTLVIVTGSEARTWSTQEPDGILGDDPLENHKIPAGQEAATRYLLEITEEMMTVGLETRKRDPSSLKAREVICCVMEILTEQGETSMEAVAGRLDLLARSAEPWKQIEKLEQEIRPSGRKAMLWPSGPDSPERVLARMNCSLESGTRGEVSAAHAALGVIEKTVEGWRREERKESRGTSRDPLHPDWVPSDRRARGEYVRRVAKVVMAYNPYLVQDEPLVEKAEDLISSVMEMLVEEGPTSMVKAVREAEGVLSTSTQSTMSDEVYKSLAERASNAPWRGERLGGDAARSFYQLARMDERGRREIEEVAGRAVSGFWQQAGQQAA